MNNDRPTDPGTNTKDREVGRAFRYAAIVAVIVASVVVTYREIEAAVDQSNTRAVAPYAKEDRKSVV